MRLRILKTIDLLGTHSGKTGEELEAEGKRNQLNLLPKPHNQSQIQAKHQTSQFTMLPEPDTSKPSNSTWPLARM